MSIIENGVVATAGGDGQAIADLRTAFDRQRAAFTMDRNPSVAERRARIKALMGMMVAYRERISAALVADFGSHPTGAAELIEVLGVLGRARYVLDHLEDWMAPSVRETDPALLARRPLRFAISPRALSATSCPGTSRSISASAR
jgi:coniferyl-aldehyde dehydrogenase